MDSIPSPHVIRGIKGLSERRRLPRLGKIRLGVKKTGSNGNTFPTEVDFFVCPPEVEAVYGPQPTSLKIMIPLEDINQVFPQAYKWYGLGSGLKCKGDGQVALRRWTDIERGLQVKIGGTHDANDLVEIPCPCPRLKTGECAPKGHFMVLLPEVSLSGIYQIDTGSANNLVEINSAIDFLRSLLGRIAMIPLTLRRVPVEITYQNKRRTHYLLKLTWEGDLQAAQQIRNTAGTITLPPLALPIPSDEGSGLSEEIVVEAAPPTLLAAPALNGSTPTPPLSTLPSKEDKPTRDSETPATRVDTRLVPAPQGEGHASHGERQPPQSEIRRPQDEGRALGAAANIPAAPVPTPAPPVAPALAAPVHTSPVALATPPPPAPAPTTPGAPPSCACGIVPSANVADYSQRYFSEVMCLTCQKKRFGKVSGGKK